MLPEPVLCASFTLLISLEPDLLPISVQDLLDNSTDSLTAFNKSPNLTELPDFTKDSEFPLSELSPTEHATSEDMTQEKHSSGPTKEKHPFTKNSSSPKSSPPFLDSPHTLLTPSEEE